MLLRFSEAVTGVELFLVSDPEVVVIMSQSGNPVIFQFRIPSVELPIVSVLGFVDSKLRDAGEHCRVGDP
jgi:hypothetical protein